MAKAKEKVQDPTGMSWSMNLRMPRPWHGMTMSVWFRLLFQHLSSPSRWPMIGAISGFSVLNSALSVVEELRYRRQTAALELKHPPLFIIGHWRTGTTLLHELMVLDEQFSFCNTFQTMAPTHFLTSGWVAQRTLPIMLPPRRVLDNMALGLDRPQEDEFALCALGLRSPYMSWAWPRNESRCDGTLELDPMPPAELERWKRTFLWYVKRMAVGDPRRIVMKSPTHTARVKTLREMFPQAQFVHIVRNPYDVFPSTIQTWKKMQWMAGLHVPNFEGLEEYLFELYDRMYTALERDRASVEPGNFCDVRYEDLVRNPVEEMREIYDHLGLSGFDLMRPRLEAYFQQTKDYQKNKHELPADLRDRITQRWAKYFERYGYPKQPLATSTPG